MKMLKVTTRDGVTMALNPHFILSVTPSDKFPDETIITILSADSNDYFIVHGDFKTITDLLITI